MENYKNIPLAESGKLTKEDEQEILNLLSDIVDDFGWENELCLLGDEEIPALQIQLTNLGKIENNALLEVAFLHPDENEKFFVVQSAVTVFNELPEDTLAEVAKAVARINMYTLAGGYGIANNMLFFRQNLVLRPEFPFETGSQEIVDALLNIRESVHASIDAMALIARGAKTLDQAVAEGLLD